MLNILEEISGWAREMSGSSSTFDFTQHLRFDSELLSRGFCFSK